MRYSYLFAALFLAGGGYTFLTSTGSSSDMNTAYADGIVSSSGAIRVPENFRQKYIMLGAWSVVGDADTDSEVGLHIVYASPGTVEEYRKTGEFPDGAVFVKELFSGKTDYLTTGEATSAREVAGYFVMVKDTKGRFPHNKLWGDGWGWSFFDAGNKVATTSKDYREDCLACHAPAEQSDFIYSFAYPLLKD